MPKTYAAVASCGNLLPRALAGRLHKWVDGGRYARFFDNLEDGITLAA
jgi:hypothetical protein